MSDALQTLSAQAGDENPLKALHAVSEMHAISAWAGR
jgi:hypothetical protein